MESIIFDKNALFGNRPNFLFIRFKYSFLIKNKSYKTNT